MEFHITENKLERWAKQEEGCLIAAGVAAPEKPVLAEKVGKTIVHQSRESKTQAGHSVTAKTPASVSS